MAARSAPLPEDPPGPVVTGQIVAEPGHKSLPPRYQAGRKSGLGETTPLAAILAATRQE